MKCFNCGKSFDYDKYYGICPKCGCYNKRIVESEHQEPANAVRERVRTHDVKIKKNGLSKSSRVLLTLVLVLLFLIFGCTPISMMYENMVIAKIQKEAVASSVKEAEHAQGEAFEFQNMKLTIGEHVIFTKEQGFPIPEDKILVAVNLSSRVEEISYLNEEVSDAYVIIDQQCFWQLPPYEYDYFQEVFGYMAYNSNDHYMEEQTEGWIAFLIDKDIRNMTVCLEERYGNGQVFIDTIHKIPLTLDMEKKNE